MRRTNQGISRGGLLLLAFASGCSARSPAHETTKRAVASPPGAVELPRPRETASASRADAREGWDPKTTYAVVVGVLAFEDPNLKGFSDRHRKDRELADTLLSRGLPREHLTLLLDADATAAAVFGALEATAKNAPPGSTLLFYYAGHGGKDESGAISFVAYDAAPKKPEHAVALSRVGEVIKKGFRGDRVLLLADCCYSGGLAEVARALKEAGKPALALTSAESSNLSTENWTFTQALIDALRGDALFDRDGDGVVALGELAEEERDAMKFRERQRSGFENAGLPPSWAIAERNAPLPKTETASMGSYVEAERAPARYAVARVVGSHGDELDVQFYDYSDTDTKTVRTSQVRPIQFTRYPVGAKLTVLWGGKQWPAEVTKADGDFEYITYPGWPSFWDEWILSDRVAPPSVRRLKPPSL